MTYYWALVGKNPDHLSLHAIEQHHSCFSSHLVWHDMSCRLLIAVAVQDAVEKSQNKYFFHCNSIKVKKSDKTWKKVIKRWRNMTFWVWQPHWSKPIGSGVGDQFCDMSLSTFTIQINHSCRWTYHFPWITMGKMIGSPWMIHMIHNEAKIPSRSLSIAFNALVQSCME